MKQDILYCKRCNNMIDNPLESFIRNDSVICPECYFRLLDLETELIPINLTLEEIN